MMNQFFKRKQNNWGLKPIIDANCAYPSYAHQFPLLLQSPTSIMAHGQGRSYNDAGLNTHMIQTEQWDKIIAFDPIQNTITCQSGITLDQILKFIVPKGLFLPVTPGTKFVSLGGAIAADIHGKNHHKVGSLSLSLIDLTLRINDQEILTCSLNTHADLFWATCGGMGLTGIIETATIKLQNIETSWIMQESIKTQNLSETMDVFQESTDWTYSVAWIDCLATGSQQGRSIVMRGEHANTDELPKHLPKHHDLKIHQEPKISCPLYAPSFLLQHGLMKTFNQLYYHKQQQKLHKSCVHYDSFFYPLDIINHWNRLYGRNGFIQYQCVFPLHTSLEAIQGMLDALATHKRGSFLAVLKLFGPSHPSQSLSFPMEGYTLTLDFKRDEGLADFCKHYLNPLVLKHEGRLYLAKDSVMDETFFKQTYPNWQQFEDIRNTYSLQKFQSLQSQRIGLGDTL